MKSFFSRKKHHTNAAVKETAEQPQDPPVAAAEQPQEAARVPSPAPSPALTPRPSLPQTPGQTPSQTPRPSPSLVPPGVASGPSSLAGSHAVLPVAHAAVVPPRAFPLTPQESRSQTPEGMGSGHAGAQKMAVTPSMVKTKHPQPQVMKGPLPPGAKIVAGGALPPGVKLMKGPIPPGAKIIKGPPPPGLTKKMASPPPPPGASPKMQATHLPQQAPAKVSPGGKSPPLTAAPRLPPRKVSPQFVSSKVAHDGNALPTPQPPPQQQQKQKSALSRSTSPRRPSDAAEGGNSHQEKEKSSNSIGGNVSGEHEELHKSGTLVKRNEENFVVPPTPRNDSDSDNGLNFVIESESADDVPQPRKDNQIMDTYGRSLSNASSLQFHAEESRHSIGSIGGKDNETAPPQRNYDSLRSSRRSSQIKEISFIATPAEIDQTQKKNVNRKEDKNINVQNSNQHRKSSLLSSSREERIGTPKGRQIKKREDEQVVSEARSSLSPPPLDKTVVRKADDSFSSTPLVFPENVLDKETLTTVSDTKSSSAARNRIAEQFLSILCPQQFYGKVTKLHRIRLVKSDPEKASGIKEHNTIFVATKGVLPNQFFYPQLRLNISDGSPVSENESPGSLDTPIVLYEAAPGNMLFADTELEAKHIMEKNSTANSCFVLEKSAIIFREPQKYALPLAMLTVRWVPYTVAQSEPQCPVHHKELQLFDRYTKELLCALCVSKKNVNASELVVIPDVLNGDSRRRITETLSRQLQQGQQNAAHWISQHKRIVSIAKHKKDAVNRQFDMLLAAIKSKREEFLEQCDATFGFALSSVAKEILMADEKLRLLKAGIDHLRTESTKPLYSMQIATVANALYASDEFPKSFSLESLKIPVLTNELTPNLEVAMSDIQQLSPTMQRRSFHRPHSPFDVRSKDDESLEEDLELERDHHHHHHNGELYKQYGKTDKRRKKVGIVSSRRQSSPQNTREGNYSRRSLLRSNSNSVRSVGLRELSPKRSMPLIPHRGSINPMLDDDILSSMRERSQWIALPGCRGTCLLDVPINEMLKGVDDVRISRTKPKYLQWTLRVNDPGEWVGIGVGVGSSPKSWSESHTPDLSHLWLVTCGDTRHTFTLRVTVNPSVGHAKLSIHDQKGRQLDDGRIPQWNAARACYPQVTFGGRIGEVILIEDLHVVSK